MKKNDWAILLATTAYSILFYHQHAGANFLLFTLLLIVCLGCLNAGNFKNKYWLFSSVLTLFSGVCVFLYGSTLSLWANIVSLLVLSGLSFNSRSSVIFNLFYSIYSIGGSVVFLIINMVNNPKQQEQEKKRNHMQILTWIIPIVLILIFFFIYKSANPLFEKFTEKINLDFISGEWLLFTLGGFLMVYGYIRHQRIQVIDNWENNLPLDLSNTKSAIPKWNEKSAAILLFVCLNVMLVFINLLDVNYLYLGTGLPEGVSHKTFVHNGVGMLILSIVLAISIIMYFFRGGLNFNEKNKSVKFLVYLWIAQNIMMVVSTMIRNNIYVNDYLLTYKRIGVYCWLFMAALGLIVTFVKIWKIKTNWYLFKTNSLIAYIVLVVAAGLDWDKYISDYNISHSKSLSQLDKRYLVSLSETNIPQLLALKDSAGFNTDSSYHYSAGSRNWSYEASYSATNSSDLDMKLYNYLRHISRDDWRSYSLRKGRVLSEIDELNAQEKIKELDFSSKYLSTLEPVFRISQVKKIDFSNGSLRSLSELGHFGQLRSLNLSSNHLATLDSIPEIKTLEELWLGDNSITELKNLQQLQGLHYLDLTGNNLSTIYSFPRLPELRELVLDNNQASDLNPLSRVSQLTSLSLNNYSAGIERFPQLNKLQYLEMNSSANVIQRSIHYLKPLPALQSLSLRNDGFVNTMMLTVYDNSRKQTTTKFPELQYLDLSENSINQLNALYVFTRLETLNLGNNQLRSAAELADLKGLKKLDLGRNLLNRIDFLDQLPQLEELSLERNSYIENFTPLKKLLLLSKLNLSGTSFNNLELISSCTNLNDLDISSCAIANLKELSNFKKLRSLSISNIKQGDVNYLAQLKQLEYLTVSVSDSKVTKQLKKALPNTKITIIDYTTTR